MLTFKKRRLGGNPAGLRKVSHPAGGDLYDPGWVELRAQWTVAIPREECVRRIKAAKDTHFAFEGTQVVRAEIRGGGVYLRGRCGDDYVSKPFLTRVDAVFDKMPNGRTHILCKGDLNMRLAVFFRLWFAMLVLAGGVMIGAFLMAPVKPSAWQVATWLAPLCALGLASVGVRRLLVSVVGSGEQAFMIEAMASAVSGADAAPVQARGLGADVQVEVTSLRPSSGAPAAAFGLGLPT